MSADPRIAATAPPPIARFDGAEAWARLSPGARSAIGALSLELVIGAKIQELAFAGDPRIDPIHDRAAGTAFAQLTAELDATVFEALPDGVLFAEDGARPCIPSYVGRLCCHCGCSQNDPCACGCGWASEDCCTACVEKGLAVVP